MCATCTVEARSAFRVVCPYRFQDCFNCDNDDYDDDDYRYCILVTTHKEEKMLCAHARLQNEP